jgi:hypothetical protein
MKKISYVLVLVLALTAMLISACGGSAAISASDSTAVGGGKPQASPVEFTGVIESINGNQWSINGQTITVDPSVVRDGPFSVGDTVKVEVQVQTDGSMVVNRVESPSAADNSNDANSNDVNSNDVNSNDVNSNDANSNSNGNGNTNDGLVIDNSSTEAFGKVDSITPDAVVIAGQAFTIANGAEFKNQIQAGNFVKVHFLLNADGTMSITQIEIWDPALVGHDNSNSNTNSNDDNGNASNSNDDNGNASTSNDDNGNDSNSNDDSSIDDNGNDDKSNDDNGGGDNSGGDNGGGGDNSGSDDGGGDDSGGGDD